MILIASFDQFDLVSDGLNMNMLLILVLLVLRGCFTNVKSMKSLDIFRIKSKPFRIHNIISEQPSSEYWMGK